MTSHTLNHFVNQALLTSHYCADVSNPLVVQEQGEVSKTRRRRKKRKETGISGFRKKKLSELQANLLEQNFNNDHKLECERKDRLAAELGLDPRQVAVWFQNRRARWRSKKLEEEYVKLKNENEKTLDEKCKLENEVVKLTGELAEAEKDIKKLLEYFPSNSQSNSTFSMETMDPPLFEEFGYEGLENVFFTPEIIDYNEGLDWGINIYGI